MLRWFLLVMVSCGLLTAQMRWRCDAKDGKFTMTPCANCKKFYCWDGQIFSDELGYTRPPGYVLAYWEEIHRKSEQVRADIDRRGKELRDQYQKATEDNAKLNQERMAASKEFNDDLKRRIDESRSSSGAPRTGMASASTTRAEPKSTVVFALPPEAGKSGPSLPPSSREKVGEVKPGMNRTAVEAILGKPHSATSISGGDGVVEALNYMLEDHATARVRIENGKVASVKISE